MHSVFILYYQRATCTDITPTSKSVSTANKCRILNVLIISFLNVQSFNSTLTLNPVLIVRQLTQPNRVSTQEQCRAGTFNTTALKASVLTVLQMTQAHALMFLQSLNCVMDTYLTGSLCALIARTRLTTSVSTHQLKDVKTIVMTIKRINVLTVQLSHQFLKSSLPSLKRFLNVSIDMLQRAKISPSTE